MDGRDDHSTQVPFPLNLAKTSFGLAYYRRLLVMLFDLREKLAACDATREKTRHLEPPLIRPHGTADPPFTTPTANHQPGPSLAPESDRLDRSSLLVPAMG